MDSQQTLFQDKADEERERKTKETLKPFHGSVAVSFGRSLAAAFETEKPEKSDVALAEQEPFNKETQRALITIVY